MSIQRMFSLVIAIISMIGFFGSLSLRMTRGANIGPGFMPLVYSIILFIFAVLFFFNDKDQPKMNWRGLFEKYTVDGLKYYLLNFGMFILIYIIGMLPAMALFGISSQVMLKRQNLRWSLIFNACWVGALYIIFVKLLDIPFETGLFF